MKRNVHNSFMHGRRRAYASTYAHIQRHFDPHSRATLDRSPPSLWPVPTSSDQAHTPPIVVAGLRSSHIPPTVVAALPTEPHPADRRSPRASLSSRQLWLTSQPLTGTRSGEPRASARGLSADESESQNKFGHVSGPFSIFFLAVQSFGPAGQAGKGRNRDSDV